MRMHILVNREEGRQFVVCELRGRLVGGEQARRRKQRGEDKRAAGVSCSHPRAEILTSNEQCGSRKENHGLRG